MRKRILLAFSLVLTVWLLFSCKKTSEEELDWEYGPFNYGEIRSISCNGGIVINLKKGTSNRIIRKTKGGPQITSFSGYMTMNGGGTIDLEVYDPLDLGFNGGGGVQCKAEDNVQLKRLGISGQSYDVRLHNITVDSSLYVNVTNMGDALVSGRTPYLSVSTTNLGRFFGFGLVTDSCLVSHTAISDIQVNVKQKLTGGVYSLGNLFYKGQPPIVNIATGGSGTAIAQPD